METQGNLVVHGNSILSGTSTFSDAGTATIGVGKAKANVAGHRLSTGSMEAVVAQHPDVAECAVIGVADSLKGQVPVGFVVLKAGVQRDSEEIQREVVASVRDEIGAVASLKEVLVVDRLPKTRSGKILRGTMRKIADGHEYQVPSTIDDPAILDEIGTALAQRRGAPERG